MTHERLEEIDRRVADAQSHHDRIRLVEAMATGEELQILAIVYNWDDGFALPTAIANHPQCDLGVALLLFWLADAVSYCTGEIEQNEYNAEWADFCRLIADRILNNHYTLGEASFATRFGATQIHKYRKLNIPEIFFTDVKGSFEPPQW